MSLPNFDYQLYNDATIIITGSGTKYVQVMGANAKVTGNVIIMDSGATAKVSHALESPTYVVQSGLSDTDLTWVDFQSVSGTIVTISGNLLDTTINAPSIIKIQNITASGTKRVKFNFRGNRA